MMTTRKDTVTLAREYIKNGSHQELFKLVTDTTDYFKVENNNIEGFCHVLLIAFTSMKSLICEI